MSTSGWRTGQLLLDVGMSSLTPIPAEAVEYGEVFTRRWVVDLILDLSGYLPDQDLAVKVAVEPACGSGAFLGPIVERLSASCRQRGRDITTAADAIQAFDLLTHNVEASRRLVEKVLIHENWSAADAAALAQRWVREGDYLLAERENGVDFVLGNPPYLRLENVPADRMAAYRAACPTMTGRADVYVGFYEVGLWSLRPEGVLGFVCADRWMRNQYGRQLRQLVSERFSVETTITMHDVDVFDEQVSAYPAITIIRRAAQRPAVVADTRGTFGPDDAARVLSWVRDEAALPFADDRFEIARLPHRYPDGESWPTGSPARLALIEELNERFPLLEDPATGTRVGIGVATGADGVFVTTKADVEPGRLLPLSMVRDTVSGRLSWSGHYLINPWNTDGQLVDLDEHPRLRNYFRRHAGVLRSRHVAVRRPLYWYRTIDKVDHSLISRPKLLFPDMKSSIHPVLDEGGLYPHHNLYYIVSDAWDLRVLGGLLLSRVAEAFVAAYAVRMRGGRSVSRRSICGVSGFPSRVLFRLPIAPPSPMPSNVATGRRRPRPRSAPTASVTRVENSRVNQEAFQRAIRSYWSIRQSQAAKQSSSGMTDAGLRGAVTGGSQLDALGQLLCFVTSSQDPEQPIHEPDPELSFANLVAAIAGRVAYINALAD